MDALSFVKKHTASKAGRVIFVLVFLFPVLGNIVSRFKKHGWWLNDYDALACGAYHMGLGQSPYSLHPVCAGLRPAVFVYAPQVGQVFAPFVNAFGLDGSRLMWLLLFLPMTGVLLWYAIFKPLPNAPFHLRLMTLAAMAGSALTCGNIGLVLHGMVLIGALQIKRSRLPFIAAVILAALIKPVMLTYLIVLAYENRPVAARARSLIIAGGCGLMAVAALMATTGPFGAAWHQTLNAVVIHEQPGIGLFSFTSLAGLTTASPLAFAIYGVFAGVMALSGLALAELGDGSAEARLAIGLGVAQLLNPRLMDYDMLALAPFMAMVVMAARPLGDRPFRYISWAFAATLIGCVIINMAEIKPIHRAPVTVFIYCLLTITVATLLVRQRRVAVVSRLQAHPWWPAMIRLPAE